MKKVVATVLITVVVCGAMWVKYAESEPLVVVNTTLAVTRDIVDKTDASGELRELRSRSLGVSNYAIVDNIYVNVGDYVQEGQILMTFTGNSSPVLDETLTDTLMSAGIDAVLTGSASITANSIVSGDIIAPFNGVVTSINVQKGEQATPLITCVSVSDTSRIRAIVKLDTAGASAVLVGMPASVKVNGVTSIYDGVVTSVSPIIKTSSSLTGSSERYCEAEVELYAPNENAISGTPVSVSISMLRRENVVLVPYNALGQNSAGVEHVFIVSDGYLVKQIVATGNEYGNLVEVTYGLAGGECVVVSSDGELTDGAKVEVRT